MNKKEFDKSEREPFSMKHFEDILCQLLTAPVSEAKSENKKPARDELNQKWGLVRDFAT